MKKPCSFTFACWLGSGCALLAVVLPGCETHPPAPYLGGRTEYISDHGGTSGSSEDGAPASVRHRVPAPSPERVAAQHRTPSVTATPGTSATPPARSPGKVESEVQDPSELRTDDTTAKKKTGGDKKATPAKVESEVRNPSDLH